MSTFVLSTLKKQRPVRKSMGSVAEVRLITTCSDLKSPGQRDFVLQEIHSWAKRILKFSIVRWFAGAPA